MQRRQQIDEGLLALADGRQVDRRLFEHPAVIGGDLRPAQQDARISGWRGLQLPGDPDRPLDVPKIAGEPDELRPAIEDRGRQGPVAEPVAEPGREDFDLPTVQPAPLGEEFQVGGRQRHVALDRLRPGRRNRQLHQQGERRVLIHRILGG